MPPPLQLLLAAAAAAAAQARARRPHVFAILADDYGWANAGWHRPGDAEVRTPAMDRLVRDGVELDRWYAFKECSPTRSAVQSGRNPIHVNVQNLGPYNANPADPVAGFSGVPRNITGLGSVMRRGGYKTAFYGKWDAGMATPDHTPRGRGYDESLFYFHHMNDYWMGWFEEDSDGDGGSSPSCPGELPQTQGRPIDLWRNGEPAAGLNNTRRCSVGMWDMCAREGGDAACPAYPGAPAAQIGGCAYEDEVFHQQMMGLVAGHDARVPLFVFWAPHLVHTPLQVPQRHLAAVAPIDDWRRRRYAAMVSALDEMVGDLAALLRRRGMYDDALIAFSSDNGGPVYMDGSAGANNWPLRGGKYSNWEGGVRVNAWASGGMIPTARRGARLDGLGCVWDWYATFARLAGVDPTDHRAAAAGLPPVDSVDLWGWISGADASSPRRGVALGTTMDHGSVAPPVMWGAAGDTAVAGWIEDDGAGGLWKLLVTPGAPMAGWTGPRFPNATETHLDQDVSSGCADGCLFELRSDPTEHVDLASAEPRRFAAMLAALREQNATTFSPNRGPAALAAACDAAVHRYGGFWGPWLP